MISVHRFMPILPSNRMLSRPLDSRSTAVNEADPISESKRAMIARKRMLAATGGLAALAAAGPAGAPSG
jgi:hypothetical protein